MKLIEFLNFLETKTFEGKIVWVNEDDIDKKKAISCQFTPTSKIIFVFGFENLMITPKETFVLNDVEFSKAESIYNHLNDPEKYLDKLINEYNWSH